MVYDVCVMTGSRADYGLLKELLFRLRDDEDIRLRLLVTGSHLSKTFGGTLEEILADGFGECVVQIPIPLEDDSKGEMAVSAGVALTAFARYFSAHRPDVLIVLGDRYEAFAAAAAAYFCGVPIAHISGGDVTEGALDDAMRHCITKMSTLHFPGCAQSARRIIQMGEQPNTVFDVGEPGVENCLKTELLSREALAESIGFRGVFGDYAVVTFHPATAEEDTAKTQVHEVIAAMDEFTELSYIITLANADAGGRAINQVWQNEADAHDNWLVVPSLGVRRYLSALHFAKLVMGNSSSGIVEAPAMRIPTVNIGDRQKGRMLAESVICCAPERNAISVCMRKALSPDFRQLTSAAQSPFGDGHTSERIMKEIKQLLVNNRGKAGKRFFDIPLPENCLAAGWSGSDALAPARGD